MSKYYSILIVMICVLLFLGCSKKPDCLELRISSQKEVYHEGEPLAIYIEFQNHCKREIVVMDPSTEFGNVFCEFRDKAGEAPEKTGSTKIGGGIDQEEYIKRQILLNPGQTHGAQNATNYRWGEELWALHSGTYTHWCEYGMAKDVWAVTGPLKRKFWFGHINSNVIQVVIKEESASKRSKRKK